MPRRFTFALIIGVLTITVAAALVTRPGPSQTVRHEDPATAPEEAQPGSVFEYVVTAFSRVSASQFPEARLLIRHLDQATLPANVRLVLPELNDLMGKDGNLVEVADRWIRDVTALTQAGRTADAQRLLSQLNAQLGRADLLFGDVSGSFQLERATPPEAAAPVDPVQRRAFEQLQRAAARIKAFLAVYRATSKNLASMAALGRLLPYQTQIEFGPLPVAYPGRPFIITGALRERAPSPSLTRRLTIYLDGRQIAEVPAKAFRIRMTMPSDIATGQHQLLAEIPAQGRYLRVRAWKTIWVSRVIPTMVADSGTWVTVPGRLSVSGSVTSPSGPLRNAAVRLSIGETRYQTTTSESGAFRIPLKLPTALSLVGPVPLSIVVLPHEPWFAPITQIHSVIVVNVVSLGLLAAILIVGVVFLFRRARRTAPVETPHKEPAPVVPVTPLPRAPLPSAAIEVRVAGPLADELLTIYRRILRRIETIAGTRAEAHTTLREFARHIPLRPAADPLWRITELAELALYSPHPVTRAQVEQARVLGTQLEGALAGA